MQNIRVCILGDHSVGKTTFISRILTGEFDNNIVDTQTILNYNNLGHNIITTTDLNYSDAVILMFDLTNHNSINYVLNQLNLLNGFGIPIILVGNKSDLNNNNWYHNTIRNFIAQNQINVYYDISAKSNYNYDKPFNYIANLF